MYEHLYRYMRTDGYYIYCWTSYLVKGQLQLHLLLHVYKSICTISQPEGDKLTCRYEETICHLV